MNCAQYAWAIGGPRKPCEFVAEGLSEVIWLRLGQFEGNSPRSAPRALLLGGPLVQTWGMSKRVLSLGPISVFLVLLAWAPACVLGDDVGNQGDYVGGSCSDDRDCDEQCVEGGDFPDGTCTVACNDDGDCPSGTNCIDKKGGVCLLTCDTPSDCRGGYTCKGEKNNGHGGDSLVCIN